MNILVAGAGAIGQWLAALLLRDGKQVTVLARPRHAAAIAGEGLRIHGSTELHGHLHAVSEVGQAGRGFDAAFLTCKAHSTAELGAAIAPLLAPSGVIVSLQNGLGNAEKLATILPIDRIAVALTSNGVTVERPGLLHHAGTGPTLVGPAPLHPGRPAAVGTQKAARTAFTVLAEVGLEPEWHDAMRPQIWRKAIVNSAVNPIAALHGLTNGKLLDSPQHFTAASAIVVEGEQVAHAAKVGLPKGDMLDALRSTLSRTSENRVSMLQDVEAKRPTEIEQITGRMVRLGARLGVAMPRSNDAYARLKTLEASYLGATASEKLTHDEVKWEQHPF